MVSKAQQHDYQLITLRQYKICAHIFLINSCILIITIDKKLKLIGEDIVNILL